MAAPAPTMQLMSCTASHGMGWSSGRAQVELSSRLSTSTHAIIPPSRLLHASLPRRSVLCPRGITSAHSSVNTTCTQSRCFRSLARTPGASGLGCCCSPGSLFLQVTSLTLAILCWEIVPHTVCHRAWHMPSVARNIAAWCAGGQGRGSITSAGTDWSLQVSGTQWDTGCWPL